MANPKVSIIIPVYNGSNYLREAIDSALGQTYDNIEVLVINDGSDDEGKTEKIAKSYEGKIRYFSKENGGVASALNLGIREMSGEYFSWLSHDDVYYPNKIETQIHYLQKQTQKNILVYSDEEIIDRYGKFLRRHLIQAVAPEDLLFSLLLKRYIGGCSLLIPKHAFTEAGVFDINLRTTQDYDMWFRLISHGYLFQHIPEMLVKSRSHQTQGIRTMRDMAMHEKNIVFKRVLREFSSDTLCGGESSKAVCYLKLALNFKKENLHEVARYSRMLGYRQINFRNFLKGQYELLFFFYSIIWNKFMTVSYWKGSILRQIRIISRRHRR